MEEHDVAGIHVLRASPDHVFGADVLPIERIHIPLDTFIAFFPADAYHFVVVFTIRRSEKRGRLARDGLHQIAAPFQLLANLRIGELRHMRVRGGMVAHLMPSGLQLRHQLGVFFRPEADQKEIGLHPVLIQNVQNPLCIGVSPCGVKADGEHFFLCIDVIHRQLARRRRRHQPRTVASRHISGCQSRQRENHGPMPYGKRTEALFVHPHRLHLSPRRFICGALCI